MPDYTEDERINMAAEEEDALSAYFETYSNDHDKIYDLAIFGSFEILDEFYSEKTLLRALEAHLLAFFKDHRIASRISLNIREAVDGRDVD
jgi:hypothetical protein